MSPDAVLGAVVTIGLVLMASLWKLATMLAEVRGQVRHNGGASLKDDARTAATEAVQARQLAEHVAAELVSFRSLQALDGARAGQLLATVQHDVTNIRAGQELLLHQQLTTDERVTDHRERNEQQVAALRDAVAAQALQLDEIRARSHRVRHTDPSGDDEPPSIES